MSLKVTVGLSKKVGQPDYGSLGVTCNVEFELDGGYDNGSTDHFRDAVRRAYTACRNAVEMEIDTNRSITASVRGQHRSPSNNRIAEQSVIGNGASSSSQGRGATSSQVRAIFAIAKRKGVDLPGLLRAQFGVDRADDLSIRNASSLIDQLKTGTTKERS